MKKTMLQRFIITTTALLACIAIQAQGTCVIKGTIADLTMSNGEIVKKVYLARIDEHGNAIKKDSAEVVKGSYTFGREMQENEPVMLHKITGFAGSSGATFFLEPGEITIYTAKASLSGDSKVAGTPTNEAYSKVTTMFINAMREGHRKFAELREQNGAEWAKSAEGRKALNRIQADERIKGNAEIRKFLLENNASPMTPLAMQTLLLPGLNKAEAMQLLESVSSTLHSHPYYKALKNKVLAIGLKEGSPLPDIDLPLIDGTKRTISNYRGKYILLDFWASWCAPCIKEIPHLQELYEETKAQSDKFVIISYSLDNKKEAWESAIQKHGLDRNGWVHACDLAGTGSGTAKLLDIKAIPRMFLIDPEGRIISHSLHGNEALEKVKQLLGDHLSQQE